MLRVRYCPCAIEYPFTPSNVRRTLDGHLFLTDNGSPIIDVSLDDRDVAELACEVNDVAGVIDHGLFLDEADEILVDTPRGIEKMVRQQA